MIKVKRVLLPLIYILLGGLTAIGPQSFAKVCPLMGESPMRCYYTARAALGIGLLIAFLGLVTVFVQSSRVRLGLSIGIAATGLLSLSVPTLLIGVCEMEKMQCRLHTYPFLIASSFLLIVISAGHTIYLSRKKD